MCSTTYSQFPTPPQFETCVQTGAPNETDPSRSNTGESVCEAINLSFKPLMHAKPVQAASPCSSSS